MRLEPQALECQCPEVAVAVLTTAPLALELATQAMEVTSFDASQRWWNIYPDRTSRMRNGPKGSEAVDSTLSRASANNNVSAHTKRPTEPTRSVGGGNTSNGVNGGATNTGSGTNVNVITSPANGGEKRKGQRDHQYASRQAELIIKALR